ncbi:MAG: sigma-70 family RNA polymerase sigma factor [Bacteroidaceae bacterium]|nr:sigma-70 family RNA polymerase sigma factor [Bacteroidaceae bacterium]
MQNYSLETDDQLVRLYEEGNDAAFDQLLARHQQKVFSYILAMVHDEDKSNDLFQEVFIKAIVRIRSHQYVESGRFLQWVIRIAHNVIIDAFRHEQLNLVVGTYDESRKLLNSAGMADTAYEDTAAVEQTYSDLETLIDRLPEAQRQVVRMRIYENKPFKEIARLTRCSINTALGRMHYAVNNLRRMALHMDMEPVA